MRHPDLPLAGRWLIMPALLMAACSGDRLSSLSNPSSATPPAAVTVDGSVTGSADGDLKAGPGPMDFVRLRLVRQTSSGTPILGQYANPGATYGMNPGETIELWAEYDAAAVPKNPKFKVEWGDGSGPDATGCGSCKLTHAFKGADLYTVRASLDDRVGSMTTRTFFLDSRSAVVTPTRTTTMRVEVRIDGRSELHLRSNEVWWHHFENAAPGRHGGTTPIKVNLIDWLPTWPDVPTSENRDCYCDSSHLTAGFDPLAAVDQTVTFNVLQGQGRATMTAVQQPAAGNGHTFILQIDDNGYGGSFVYIVELTYLTPAG